MKVNEVTGDNTVDEITLKITAKEDPKDLRGGSLRVCNLTGEDDTGKITVALWNQDIDTVKVGDTIKITKGWARIFNDQLQVSSGKFGTIEVLGKEKEG